MKKEFFMFAIAGTIGFLVDAGTFQVFYWIIDNPYIARLGSYLCAATATWYINRTYTFTYMARNLAKHHLFREWFKFVTSQTLGFCVNYGTFSLLVLTVDIVNQYPVIGIAAGSIAGLFVNFIVSKYYVFKKHHDKQHRG